MEKTNQMNIGKMEATFEVYTDEMIEAADNSVDQALLWILRHQDIKEFCVRTNYNSIFRTAKNKRCYITKN